MMDAVEGEMVTRCGTLCTVQKEERKVGLHDQTCGVRFSVQPQYWQYSQTPCTGERV